MASNNYAIPPSLRNCELTIETMGSGKHQMKIKTLPGGQGVIPITPITITVSASSVKSANKEFRRIADKIYARGGFAAFVSADSEDRERFVKGTRGKIDPSDSGTVSISVEKRISLPKRMKKGAVNKAKSLGRTVLGVISGARRTVSTAISSAKERFINSRASNHANTPEKNALRDTFNAKMAGKILPYALALCESLHQPISIRPIKEGEDPNLYIKELSERLEGLRNELIESVDVKLEDDSLDDEAKRMLEIIKENLTSLEERLGYGMQISNVPLASYGQACDHIEYAARTVFAEFLKAEMSGVMIRPMDNKAIERFEEPVATFSGEDVTYGSMRERSKEGCIDFAYVQGSYGRVSDGRGHDSVPGKQQLGAIWKDFDDQVNGMLENFEGTVGELKQELYRILASNNEEFAAISSTLTLAIIVVVDGKRCAVTVNLGDSQLYAYSKDNSSLTPLTKIARSELGNTEEFTPEIGIHQLDEDAVILGLTDGIIDFLSHEDIVEVMKANENIETLLVEFIKKIENRGAPILASFKEMLEDLSEEDLEGVIRDVLDETPDSSNYQEIFHELLKDRHGIESPVKLTDFHKALEIVVLKSLTKAEIDEVMENFVGEDRLKQTLLAARSKSREELDSMVSVHNPDDKHGSDDVSLFVLEF